jgi:curli biogenesis system outer membrane secretion channel CsgG
MSRITLLALPISLLSLAACATESHRTLATETVATYGTNYDGVKISLAIGKFQNSSPYMRGIFSSGEDRLGNQAKTILKTHLSQTGRFALVDRDNMQEIAREAEISGQGQGLVGARYVITGQVTEFGRKTVGDKQLFGILGRGKTQIAYSKVSINVVDVRTSLVVFSMQGAGEYSLSNREVIGFGGTASYDSTLNGKVLNLSITDTVNKLVAAMQGGAWKPATN